MRLVLIKKYDFKYRTRANKGRSILEAAPLRDQAKTQFTLFKFRKSPKRNCHGKIQRISTYLSTSNGKKGFKIKFCRDPRPKLALKDPK